MSTRPILGVGMYPPEYLESLEHKKEIATDLCEALLEYLTHDLELMIEQVNRKPPRPPRPTIEELNKAQTDLDLIERQMEGMEAYFEEIPGPMAEIIRTTQVPIIERHREDLRERVAMIQRALEEPDPDPSSPWDGSHRIGTLCAQCAVRFDGVAKSIPALKPMLKNAGWGRDSDGDHICPKCLTVLEESKRCA